MTAEWCNAYVGIPYKLGGQDRDGLDCYSLLRLVFLEQRGIALPDWHAGPDLVDQVRTIDSHLADERAAGRALQVAGPEAWAVAMVMRRAAPNHCGLVVGDPWAFGVLHCYANAGVVYDPLARFTNVYQGATWWRWLQ